MRPPPRGLLDGSTSWEWRNIVQCNGQFTVHVWSKRDQPRFEPRASAASPSAGVPDNKHAERHCGADDDHPSSGPAAFAGPTPALSLFFATAAAVAANGGTHAEKGHATRPAATAA